VAGDEIGASALALVPAALRFSVLEQQRDDRRRAVDLRLDRRAYRR
jgi:hypothetical protein